MGLFQAAYRTYENHSNNVGIILENEDPLTPVSHTIQNVQIEITIYVDGKFDSAVKVSKENLKTIIPVTIESASRTSGKSAHPLCDNLSYLAPFGGEKFDAYLQQLREWAESEYTHPKVQAVYNYISRETILTDLADSAGVIELDGDVPSNGKIEGMEYGKCLVRWRIIPQESGVKTACWEDRDLFDCYIKYFAYKNRDAERDICLIAGEEDMLCEMHPKGVISNPNGAKLISGNDSSNFTYRGRFITPRQAYNVGYSASQKAHNALRWVVSNHGVYMGGRTFICWNPEAHKVPPPPLSKKFQQSDPKKPIDLRAYKDEVHDTIIGHKKSLDDDDDVVISALEAATTGRLSVTYYNELRASDFLKRLEQWYITCCCDRGSWGIQSPSIRDIINCAFGTFREDSKFKNNKFEADSNALKVHTQRLLHCVLEQQPIPLDIMHALVVKAGNLQILSKSTRENLLFLTCAVVRKYKNDKSKKEEWNLALDIENKDRSYLFGRLLAVAELAERRAYKKLDEEREPNAIRLQSVFVQRPMYAWGILEEKLVPYYAQLKPGTRKYYKDIVTEIVDKLSFGTADTDSTLRSRLDETYLLGYYHQRSDIYRNKKIAGITDETDEMNEVNEMEENDNE